MATPNLVVLSTVPDEAEASRLASALVDGKLAACVNIVGPVRSVYWWEGKVQNDSEVLMICKTDEDHLDSLTRTVLDMHPYTCPEVVALSIVGGAPDYLAWIGESLG